MVRAKKSVREREMERNKDKKNELLRDREGKGEM